jgi:hypothetical protein
MIRLNAKPIKYAIQVSKLGKSARFVVGYRIKMSGLGRAGYRPPLGAIPDEPGDPVISTGCPFASGMMLTSKVAPGLTFKVPTGSRGPSWVKAQNTW